MYTYNVSFGSVLSTNSTFGTLAKQYVRVDALQYASED